MLSNFKYLDGGILFTTANIYLREGMDELIAQGVQGPQCTMIYTMYAATKGGAYIISEPMIDQGQDILWKDEAYDIVILNFNNVLLKLVNNGAIICATKTIYLLSSPLVQRFPKLQKS